MVMKTYHDHVLCPWNSSSLLPTRRILWCTQASVWHSLSLNLRAFHTIQSAHDTRKLLFLSSRFHLVNLTSISLAKTKYLINLGTILLLLKVMMPDVKQSFIKMYVYVDVARKMPKIIRYYGRLNKEFHNLELESGYCIWYLVVTKGHTIYICSGSYI